MTKRMLSAAAVVAALAVSASAGAHNMGGCGLGSLIFKENEKPHQILASTTNGVFGNQTFGISSETLGCTKDGHVRADKEREVFAAVNLQKLRQEMAQGGGEYLSAFAGLMGCADGEPKAAFSRLAQRRYPEIFAGPEAGAAELVERTRAAASADTEVSRSCAL